MYKVKVICSNPKHNGPSLHPVTGEVLYILTSTPALRDVTPRRQECLTCGEARRDAEDKAKQDRLKRLFTEDTQRD